ncbi:MAG: TIM barrel protein [Clostridia bacterium]|nr:TIM barrel protein [Clostridia bacterium]
MRFCVPLPCFFKKTDFADALRTVADLGFDAVETYNWKNLDPDAVRAACAETGVEFLSMCTTEFRMTDPQFRTLWLEGLKESCIAANQMGVGKLITQVGPDTGAERGYQHEAIVETLRQAKPILDTYGVTVMIEPLNVLVNHPGYYLVSSLEGFDIVREVDHPHVKVVYDIYHQQVSEGNIIPNMTKNLDCIAHLHSAGHPGRHELQYGESDYHVILKAADDAGYTGACGLEYGPLLEPIESLKTFRKLYADLL